MDLYTSIGRILIIKKKVRFFQMLLLNQKGEKVTENNYATLDWDISNPEG